MLINELRKWLKKEGNSAALLAAKLGYKHSATIYNWLNRGRIPSYQLEGVKNVIDDGKNSKSKKNI